MAFQTLLQEGVTRLHPFDARSFLQTRYHRLKLFGEDCQSTKIIDVRQKLHRVQNVADVRTNFGRKDLQNANHLTLLRSLEFADAIVGIHHRSRFDEHRLSARTLIVNDTFDFTLQRRSHGDDQTAIAKRGRNITIDVSFGLRLVDDGTQTMADVARSHLDAVTNVEQFGGSCVLDLAIFVEHKVNALDDLWKCAHAFCHACQSRIDHFGRYLGILRLARSIFGDCIRPFSTRSEKLHKAHHSLQRAFEIKKVEFFEISAFRTNAQQGLSHIIEVFLIHFLFGHAEEGKFAGLFERFFHQLEFVGKLHLIVHPLRA